MILKRTQQRTSLGYTQVTHLEILKIKVLRAVVAEEKVKQSGRVWKLIQYLIDFTTEAKWDEQVCCMDHRKILYATRGYDWINFQLVNEASVAHGVGIVRLCHASRSSALLIISLTDMWVRLLICSTFLIGDLPLDLLPSTMISTVSFSMPSLHLGCVYRITICDLDRWN